MRHLLILVTVIALLSLPALVVAADVSGTWTASFDTQIGKQEYTYVFQVKDSQLSGRAKSGNGDVELKNGKVEGDKVSFVENLTIQGMDITITYEGTIVSNDEIKFTRDVGGFVTEELVAKRVK